MDFVNDTPISEYGLAQDLLGKNYGYGWERRNAPYDARDREAQHSYMYIDSNGYQNASFWDMPGDVRDYGEF